MRDELQRERDGHAAEMTELQRAVDVVREELAAARERNAAEDGELGRTRATLEERTDLLRDMVSDGS